MAKRDFLAIPDFSRTELFDLLAAYGVDLLAVIRGVFGHDDPAESARQYATLFAGRAQDEET